MRKFSWYTNPVKVTDYLTFYQYAVDREILIEKRKDGSQRFILVKKGTYVTSHDGGWQRYKPNRKGGHTHFHRFNAIIRKYDRRKIKRKFKRSLLLAEFSNIMCRALGLPSLYNLDPKRINQINRIKKRRSHMACGGKKSGGKKPPKK